MKVRVCWTHHVHGPDVVEEVGGAEPRVGLRHEVRGLHEVARARPRAHHRARHARERGLHGRHQPGEWRHHYNVLIKVDLFK